MHEGGEGGISRGDPKLPWIHANSKRILVDRQVWIKEEIGGLMIANFSDSLLVRIWHPGSLYALLLLLLLMLCAR